MEMGTVKVGRETGNGVGQKRNSKDLVTRSAKIGGGKIEIWRRFNG